jgi:DNA (cytosine-5)-methyltransferase 1
MIFLDAFAGGGLGRLGMEQAGWECAGYIEIDKYARQAYKAYFDTSGEWMCHDIRTADPVSMPGFDCLLGGWPCQDSSVAGLRRGLEGDQSSLVFEYVRILRSKKPRYFIAEQPLGLYITNRRDFYTVIEAFAGAGYDVQWQILNTAAYLPQNRERFYFVGHLIGAVPRPQIFPIKGDDSLPAQPTADKQESQVANCLTVRQESRDNHGARTLVVIQDRHELRLHKTLNSTPALKARMGTGGNNMPMIVQRSQSGTRRSPTCGTLRCEASRSSNFTVEDGDRLRRLTPRECFRLQGAPEDYIDTVTSAGISDMQLYKIAGNAMSVPVVYEIARRLRASMQIEGDSR